MRHKRCCLPFCRAPAAVFVVEARERMTGKIWSRLLTCRAHRGVVARAFLGERVQIRRRRREVVS